VTFNREIQDFSLQQQNVNSFNLMGVFECSYVYTWSLDTYIMWRWCEKWENDTI